MAPQVHVRRESGVSRTPPHDSPRSRRCRLRRRRRSRSDCGPISPWTITHPDGVGHLPSGDECRCARGRTRRRPGPRRASVRPPRRRSTWFAALPRGQRLPGPRHLADDGGGRGQSSTGDGADDPADPPGPQSDDRAPQPASGQHPGGDRARELPRRPGPRRMGDRPARERPVSRLSDHLLPARKRVCRVFAADAPGPRRTARQPDRPAGVQPGLPTRPGTRLAVRGQRHHPRLSLAAVSGVSRRGHRDRGRLRRWPPRARPARRQPRDGHPAAGFDGAVLTALRPHFRTGRAQSTDRSPRSDHRRGARPEDPAALHPDRGARSSPDAGSAHPGHGPAQHAHPVRRTRGDGRRRPRHARRDHRRRRGFGDPGMAGSGPRLSTDPPPACRPKRVRPSTSRPGSST